MNKPNKQGSPRRAAEVDEIADQSVDVEIITTTSPARARRLGKGTTAGVLACAMGALGLFGYAFSQRSAQEDLVSDHVAVDVAVPDDAVKAAQRGFVDRTEQASRNSVRENVTNVVADVNAADREQAMGQYLSGAYQVSSQAAAKQRDHKMDADMELVEKQADELKREAQEAARRLEAARKAAAEAKAKAKTAEGRDGQLSESADDDAATGEPGDDDSAEVSEADIAAISSTGGSMPLKSNYRVGASFGQTGSWSRYHTGQDFPAPVGTPIYAAASGIVLSPTSGGWAGTNVVIQHSNGGATLYAHMSRKTVGTGEAVKPGQLIGYVGMSGRTFGPHLHMEYYKAGVTPGKVYQASDPMAFLRSLGVR